MIRFYPFPALLGALGVIFGGMALSEGHALGGAAMAVGFILIWLSIDDQDPPLGV